MIWLTHCVSCGEHIGFCTDREPHQCSPAHIASREAANTAASFGDLALVDPMNRCENERMRAGFEMLGEDYNS